MAVVGAAVAIIVFTTASGTNYSTATPTRTPPAGSPIDGIKCESEMTQTHYHAHLALLDNGKDVAAPAGIGINQDAGCLYWLHTHQTNGIVHIESPGPSKFTLGRLLDIWGQPLSSARAGPLTAQLENSYVSTSMGSASRAIRAPSNCNLISCW